MIYRKNISKKELEKRAIAVKEFLKDVEFVIGDIPINESKDTNLNIYKTNKSIKVHVITSGTDGRSPQHSTRFKIIGNHNFEIPIDINTGAVTFDYKKYNNEIQFGLRDSLQDTLGALALYSLDEIRNEYYGNTEKSRFYDKLEEFNNIPKSEMEILVRNANKIMIIKR